MRIWIHVTVLCLIAPQIFSLGTRTVVANPTQYLKHKTGSISGQDFCFSNSNLSNFRIGGNGVVFLFRTQGGNSTNVDVLLPRQSQTIQSILSCEPRSSIASLTSGQVGTPGPLMRSNPIWSFFTFPPLFRSYNAQSKLRRSVHIIWCSKEICRTRSWKALSAVKYLDRPSGSFLQERDWHICNCRRDHVPDSLPYIVVFLSSQPKSPV